MRKIFSFILAVIMAVSLAGCGRQTPAIEIVNSRQPAQITQLTVPMELENYNDVTLVSFDGQYAIFRIDRTYTFLSDDEIKETAKIVVYDVQQQKTVHLVSLDIREGRVHSAAKHGDKLYFAVGFADNKTAKVYENNGLETKELAFFEENSIYNGQEITVSDGNVILTVTAGDIGKGEYDFYLLEDGQCKHIFQHSRDYDIPFIKNVKYDGTISFTEVKNDEENNKMTVNRWKGENCTEVLSLPGDEAYYLGIMDNMIFHNLQHPDGKPPVLMLAVTDTDSKKTTEIELMKVAGFITDGEDFGMFTHGESYEKLTLVKVNDKTATLTAVETENIHRPGCSYRIATDSMFVWQQAGEGTDAQMYLIKP